MTEDTLRRLTLRLVDALHPERIYLFGSRAEGRNGPDSDLDLLIVVPEGGQANVRTEACARGIIGDVGCGVDVLVYTADRFDRRSGWRANFEHTVRNKGRLLYGVDGMAFAREWLEKASRDRMSADLLLGGETPLLDMAAFHYQQAVEKTLKAFLVHHNDPFEKLHDLGLLCDRCAAIEGGFAALGERVAVLNRYAVQLRYPDEPVPSLAEVHEARKIAHEVRELVLDRLPREARPKGT